MSATTTTAGFELRGERSRLLPMLRSLYQSRDLLRALAKKNFVASYRRASLGMLWAVGLPLIEAAVLSVVFSDIIPIRAGRGRSFPVFMFAGILPWSFFIGTVAASVNAIVGGSNLSTRIYFPRALFPLINVRANLYGFMPAVIILLIMCIVFRVPIGWHMLLLVPAVIHMILLTAAFSLVVAALQVYFRDVKWFVQASIRPWFYATGVFFPLHLAPEGLQAVLRMNPSVGLVQMFRAGTVGGDVNWQIAVWWSVGWTAALLALAAFLYRRYDRVFADRL
jgi:homopolymeric O-antigen transport system permease protein